MTEFITRPVNGFIGRLWNNKHTSGAALVYIGTNALAGLGTVWLPHYKDQFDQTANLIGKAAVGYGLVMAGDAGPTPPTSHLDEKPDPKKGTK